MKFEFVSYSKLKYVFSSFCIDIMHWNWLYQKYNIWNWIRNFEEKKKRADDNLKFGNNAVDSPYFELLSKMAKTGSDERLGYVSCQV
jgi:hypothetical protein